MLELEKIFKNNKLYYQKETIEIVDIAMKSKPFPAMLLRGKPGVGKTAMVESLGKETTLEGGNYLFQGCHMGMREEDLLFKIYPDPDMTTESGIKIFDGVLVEALEKSLHQKVVLCIDEIDKAHPSIDAVLLDFLQNCRYLSPLKKLKGNPDNLIVFFTTNEERELSDPLLSRLTVLDIDICTKTVRKILSDNLGNDFEHLDSLLMLNERCKMGNVNTSPRELIKLGTAIKNSQDPNWNQLVYSFVSKTKENHYKLGEVEHFNINITEEDNFELNPAAYEIEEKIEEEIEIKIEKEKKRMPTIRRKKISIIDKTTTITKISEEEEIYGILTKDKIGETLTHHSELISISNNPNNLGNCQIIENNLIIKASIEFKGRKSIDLLTDYKDYAFFHLSFENSDVSEILKTIKTNNEDIKSFVTFFLKTNLFTIDHLTSNQVILKSKNLNDNLSLSINFVDELIEIETNGSNESKNILKELSTFLLSDSRYSNNLKNLKTKKMLEDEKHQELEDKKNKILEEQTKTLEKELKAKKIIEKKKEGEKIIEWIFNGQFQLIKLINNQISNCNNTLLTDSVVEQSQQLLEMIYIEKRLTQKIKQIAINYSQKYNIIEIEDFLENKDSFIETEYYIKTRTNKQDILIPIAALIYKRIKKITTLQEKHHTTLLAKKELSKINEEKL